MARSKIALHEPSNVPIKRQYLVVYNAVSFLLWASLLGRTVLASTAGIRHVYPQSGTFARNVQTLAVLEVLHSLVGVVRAPIMTTGIQVASRLLLVWGIVHMFGDSMLLGSKVKSTLGLGQDPVVQHNQLAYLGMLVAWSLTEVVRYSYFVVFLGSGGETASVPKVLSWLRYNLFFALYPVGISCEFWMIYKALPYAKQWDERYQYFLMAVLVAYIPGM